MVVCHCLALNDRSITALFDESVVTFEDVKARCGAGAKCGGCHEAITDLLARMEQAVSVR